MKVLKYFTLLLILISTSFLSKAQDVPNAIDIVKKSLSARGGEAYLKSIKTLYTNMKTEMEGREVNWVVKEMLPNKGSFQIVYKDRVVFQNWFDGNVGYETVDGEVKKADPKEFEDKAFKQNIFNELDYINPQLWSLELVGEDKVGDTNCYKIRGTLKNGLVELFYFDKSTYLMLRSDKIQNKNKNSFTSTIYLKYKKSGNLIYSSENRIGNGDNLQTLKIEELFVNDLVKESDFKP